MANEMRDRLVEIIGDKPFSTEYERYDSFEWAEHFADHLIENGVIVPPCKVGDVVYYLETIVSDKRCENCNYYYEGGVGDTPACDKTRYGNRSFECIEIKEVLVTEKDLYWWLYMNDFGKTVFLTREEAEQRLQEMRGE
jgi:hypothetical protein